MRPRRLHIIAAAILAILVSQWAYAAHVHKHHVGADDPTCQLCIHGHHLKGAIPIAEARPIGNTASPVPAPVKLRPAAEAAPIVPVARAPPRTRPGS